jgi:palmitoyl transferase
MKFWQRFDSRQRRRVSARQALHAGAFEWHALPQSTTGATMRLQSKARRPRFPRAAMLAGAILLAPHAHAAPDWWRGAGDRLETIADQGATDLYLSGYAHHGRGTYTRERLAELNEQAWGIGIGRRLRNDRGNDEIVYALGISDSHRKPQPMAGYGHEWIQPLGAGLEAGGGFTAMLMSRADYFHGIPFPIVLPIVSFGSRDIKLRASYVPRLSQQKGNGDVLLLFFSIAL